MDTSMVQYSLREKDIKKAACLLELPEEELKKFNTMKLLNTAYIRALLMRGDYEKLTSGLHYLESHDKRYRYPEVIKAIAHEYGVSPKTVSSVLHGHNEQVYFCSRCGIRITKQGARERGGLCSNCYADTMGL